MKTLFSIILLLILFIELNAQKITSIDLTSNKFEEIKAEKVFKDIEIIPLETHPDALLDKKYAYYLTDKYIIAACFFDGAYLFDRKTGDFIRQISSMGQGPDEYVGFIYHKYGFDEQKNLLFACDGLYAPIWKCLNIETNKVETILQKPLPENENEVFSLYVPWRMKDNTYVSFNNNRKGKEKTRLIFFNKEGNIIKRYSNHLEYDNKGAISYPFNPGIFYNYKDRTYFKEWFYNDTVFCIDKNKMLPHIIFEAGKKQPSYYHQNDFDQNKEKYLINFVYESDGFVFFNFFYRTDSNEITHAGYYDKKSKQTYISSTPDLKKTGYILNGIPIGVCPISINQKKEMIASINPEELVKYKDQIGPKYKHLFQKIEEDDNPIIVIAKIKE